MPCRAHPTKVASMVINDEFTLTLRSMYSVEGLFDDNKF